MFHSTGLTYMFEAGGKFYFWYCLDLAVSKSPHRRTWMESSGLWRIRERRLWRPKEFLDERNSEGFLSLPVVVRSFHNHPGTHNVSKIYAGSSSAQWIQPMPAPFPRDIKLAPSASLSFSLIRASKLSLSLPLLLFPFFFFLMLDFLVFWLHGWFESHFIYSVYLSSWQIQDWALLTIFCGSLILDGTASITGASPSHSQMDPDRFARPIPFNSRHSSTRGYQA